MVNIYIKLRLLLMLSMCGLFFYTSSIVFPQGKKDSKIVFLHLRMKDGVITLLNTKIKPGYLKPQPTSGVKGDILYEVSDISGTSVWQGVSTNPSRRRYEY